MDENNNKKYLTDDTRLIAEWDWEANNIIHLNPNELTLGSGKKANWVCANGHHWMATIDKRNKGQNCPYCSGHRVLREESLAIKFSNLLAEWDWGANSTIGLDPYKLSVGSNKKAFWICNKCGYKWNAEIWTRTRNGYGCPNCGKNLSIKNRIQNKIAKEGSLKTLFPELINEWDYDKNLILPENILPQSGISVWWKCTKGHSWKTRVQYRTRGYGCPYCFGYKASKGQNDLATLNPELAKEWHPTKNVDLTPTSVRQYSNVKVWWLGKCGHEWQATIADRNKNGCPFCANILVLPGFNDLATRAPELLPYWDYDKNYPLTPQHISPNSTKKVWWKCEQGHSWGNSVVNMNNSLHTCPYCENRKVLSGFNDLGTKFPNISNEWLSDKNGEATPSNILYNTTKKVWWKCSKGHIYYNSVYYRTHDNGGCPICAKGRSTSFPEKAIAYYLSKKYKVQENYKFFKNKELDVYIPSRKVGIEYDGKAWHNNVTRDNIKNDLCKKLGIVLLRVREPSLPNVNENAICYQLRSNTDHELEKAINFIFSYLQSTTDNLTDIKVDINSDRAKIFKLIEIQEKATSLSVVNSQLANEWHPTKNGNLLPNQFTANAHFKVWWLGKCGHEWQATIASRNSGSGCPYCTGVLTNIGVNDLVAINSPLLAEWDYDRNTEISPSTVSKGSNKKVWWKCLKCGSSWQAAISDRSNGNGCPVCRNIKIVAGINDLTSNFPDLAKEWDINKNILKPIEVGTNSSKSVWWTCHTCGYSWKTQVYNRTKGHGCPVCCNRIIIAGFNDLATKYPELANEWDYEKNEITPNAVSTGSGKRVWWKCSKCGFEWITSVANRTRGTSCPKCSREKSPN